MTASFLFRQACKIELRILQGRGDYLGSLEVLKLVLLGSGAEFAAQIGRGHGAAALAEIGVARLV